MAPTTERIHSLFGRLAVQDQGVSQQAWSFLRAMRKNLFRASPLGSNDLLAIFGVPGLVEASPETLPSSSYNVLPVRVSVSKFPPLIRTPVILD